MCCFPGIPGLPFIRVAEFKRSRHFMSIRAMIGNLFNKIEGQRWSNWEQSRNKALKTGVSARVLEKTLRVVWEAISICIPVCWAQTYLFVTHVVVCVLLSSHPQSYSSSCFPPSLLPSLPPSPPMATTTTTSNYPHAGSWGYFPIRTLGMWCWL